MVAKVNKWKKLKGWIDKVKTVFEVVKLAKVIWALIFTVAAAGVVGYSKLKDSNERVEALREMYYEISVNKPTPKPIDVKPDNSKLEKELEQIKKDIKDLKGWHGE